MFDFDEIYKIYPRKLGKTLGIKRCKMKIKTQKKYDQLRQAVVNYSEYTQGTEPQYIKHFSTFMNCWEDFIDIEESNSEVSITRLRSVK